MINCVGNGANPKRLNTKHIPYHYRHSNGDLKAKKLPQPQSHKFNNSKSKDTNSSSNFTQRALFSKHNFINDLTKHSQSLINTLSPKCDKKCPKQTKTSGPHTPSKASDILFTLDIQYNSQAIQMTIDRRDDGFSIASKLDMSLALRLDTSELEALALYLTQRINSLIDAMPVTHVHNTTQGNRSINGFVIDLNEILLQFSKIKIVIKHGKMIFNYHISSSPDEINDVIEDVIAKISNEDKKYNKVTLKGKMILLINQSIDNTFKSK